MDDKELIEFEKLIGEHFKNKKIKAPIHLSGGNEAQLIYRFKNIKKGDWIFSTHRSHYHYLLAGGDPKYLEQEILKGNSMHIFDKRINFFSSAIVGGILPIALGVALAIKRKKEDRHVWCFIGDMASKMGLFHECERYASGFDLPITFVIEDNGYSTNTPTDEAWGKGKRDVVEYYSYERTYPHVGLKEWVQM
jgi:TPP-dependent pyruvate/acetoin dehydrogenase alpha subunit